MAFDVQTFRQAFPYFQREDAVVYLDNAATALKPQVLINRTAEFYASAGSVHRSQYDAAQTAQYEQARTQVKELINAEDKTRCYLDFGYNSRNKLSGKWITTAIKRRR
ncbi:predicted selenocysteine lyase [Haemophilus influenzae R3021]|uniref:Predicted selenocysteine lyase n=1 Tax=Haemophilus influenzae R3021 TaxID=375432 RepID=A4N3W1_HAEIF|nr:predicted selenocysteine lyase [Haemophilus influenzae R3021]